MRSAVSIRSSFLFFTWKYALLSFIIHILQQDEEKEQMEEINERLKMAVFSEEGNQEISRLKNIGLENINYRIRIYYGETEAGVRLEEENPGTRVEFYIPMRREE